MGLGSVEGPPKKKLKQAQLNFCVSTEKISHKRKLSDPSDGLATKLFRKDSGAPKPPAFNKENVIVVDDDEEVQSVGVSVPKKNELENDVVLIEDDPKDVTDESVQKPSQEGTGDSQEKSTALNVAPSEQGSKTVDDVNGDSKTDATETRSSENEVKTSQGDVETTSGSKVDESKVASTQLTNAEPLCQERPVDSEKSSKDSKHDKSVESDQADMNGSVVLSSGDEQDTPATSPNQKTTPGKLKMTPKSASKKAERERQREEKLRLKKEKEEQRRKEKEDKEKKKQEELRLKEEERKKKEEERKRKEEEKKRKEEERKKKEEVKEEEKRKKEEERKKKDEERKKKDEEKKKKEELKEEDRRKKEEAERKENLAKAAFTKFFIQEKSKPSLPKKDETEVQDDKTEKLKFMPFPVKSDMRLAVQVRRTLDEDEKKVLNEALVSNQPLENLYINELKKGRKPRTGSATWPLSDEQHDVIIVEFVEDDKSDAVQEAKSQGKSQGQKAKLLQFHENRRPPYWGTWRKPSKAVGPRRPLGQDKILDYEVDSDSEWEDEEEGEDIDKEDGESDKEEADDENVGENGYMLDNTFVPHGYLSDEEAAEAEDDESVEDQKLKLTVLKQEFDQELKSKTQRLQPRLLGCVYISNQILEVSKSLYEPLMKLRCKWEPNEDPIDVLSPAVIECNPSPSVLNTKFPSSMIGQLAKLIHGNRSSLKALISEFLDSCEKDNQLSAISKRAVFLKVKEIAAKTHRSRSGRLVWVVNPDLCHEFGLEPLVEPTVTTPVATPFVEPPKPKDSPLANFLKKTSSPQGPVKRVSNTLVSRDISLEPHSSEGHCGSVHVDTPRPKFTPQGSASSAAPPKFKRRVVPTLISSVVGPVCNKAYNVVEIYKPGSSPLATMLPKSETVDLTDSNDGITPLPDVIGSSTTNSVAGSLDASSKGTPIPDTSKHLTKDCPMSDSSADPPDASNREPSNPPLRAGSAVPSSSAESSKGTPYPETSKPHLAKDSSMPDSSADLPKNISSPEHSKPPVMETKDSPMPTSSAKVSDQANSAAIAAGPSESIPVPMETDSPKQVKLETTKPSPSTPAPIRKRVPLITLSKHVSNPKSIKSPGQKSTIADMFCRKSVQKDAPSQPIPAVASSVVIDLASEPSN